MSLLIYTSVTLFFWILKYFSSVKCQVHHYTVKKTKEGKER